MTVTIKHRTLGCRPEKLAAQVRVSGQEDRPSLVQPRAYLGAVLEVASRAKSGELFFGSTPFSSGSPAAFWKHALPWQHVLLEARTLLHVPSTRLLSYPLASSPPRLCAHSPCADIQVLGPQ